MDLSNLSFFYGESFDTDAIGMIIYRQEAHKFDGSLLHDFDYIVLIVREGQEAELVVEHTLVGGLPCQTLHVSAESLQSWLITGDKGDLIRCFVEGELVRDDGGKLARLRHEYAAFDQPLRDRQMLYEFSRFLSIYVEAKRYLQAGYVIDAYQSVLDSLKHWARIELIERGVLPNQAVWEQVKELNTAIHKLYEELTQSTETIRQRVELVLLACEFSVMSKMAECSVLLFRVLGSRTQPWSIEELIHHPDLRIVKNELPLVMRKLVNRSLVKETAAWSDDSGSDSPGIRYSTE
ncbi:nucleotidyltransferase-like protein [Paenibacillus sp. VCA1]|uniref:nucleotidyltransferase-like protein n=1 Tax=Paenibacillus sp. VCA1 TaxID=3039148 RepID=UPI002871484A|nr:nucleotidyltransferase-like protein [Paenibacillus sp. VCA1]MDR9857114.1 nucleotidyltransferase-like protein [Paenibacillus sp. VCA1]